MENYLGALKVLIDHIDDSYVSVTDEWKRKSQKNYGLLH